MSDRLLTPGREHIVDAYGCSESALRSKATLERLVGRILGEMQLRMLGDPVWHVFPGAGGVTGLVMLAESHLSMHTFPEHRYAAFNLYCCRQTAEWGWEAGLTELLGAEKVVVRTVVRGGTPSDEAVPAGLAKRSGPS